MLFMRSAGVAKDDLTARARIRDSAIVYFGRHGFQSATVRAIAADAGVSPALVIHHFGSKDGLRAACDDHLTFSIDDLADHAASHLEAVDLLDLMSRTPQLTPLVPYMIQTITEGGDFAVKLWDRLVQDTETYLRAAVSAGKVRPTDDERVRAEVLSTFKLGMYLLSRYILPTPSSGEPGDIDIAALSARFTVPTLELFTRGMFTTSEYLDLFTTQQHAASTAADPSPGAVGPPGRPAPGTDRT